MEFPQGHACPCVETATLPDIIKIIMLRNYKRNNLKNKTQGRKGLYMKMIVISAIYHYELG